LKFNTKNVLKKKDSNEKMQTILIEKKQFKYANIPSMNNFESWYFDIASISFV
jgi:hypothetical protein